MQTVVRAGMLRARRHQRQAAACRSAAGWKHSKAGVLEAFAFSLSFRLGPRSVLELCDASPRSTEIQLPLNRCCRLGAAGR